MPNNTTKKTKKTTNINSKNKRLGKGLDAIFGGDITTLIDDIENNTPASKQVLVSLDEIRPNPYQPRKLFDEEKLQELAVSIKEHGVFQPVILKSSIQGYEIVAGERRCRAARIAGLTEIPAIIVDFTDQQMMEIALLENIQREDLNSIEEARAYQQMMERLELTQEELGKRIGKSRSYIANTLRLLQLPDKIQNYVLEGKITMGHVENIVKGIELGKTRKNQPKVEKPKEYKYVEDLLRKKFRTKIKVDDKALTIKYTDIKDLNRILELMGVIEES